MRFSKHLKLKDGMGRKTRSGILALTCSWVNNGVLKAEQYYNIAVEKRDGPLAKATIVNGDSVSREIFDFDQDGWCDIWMSINRDEKGILTVLGDCDGDGLTDYEEMIMWRNPFVAGPLPQKQLILGKEEEKHLQWKREAERRIQSRCSDELKWGEFHRKLDLERRKQLLFPASSVFYSAKDKSSPPTAKSSNTASDEICITNFQRLESGAVLFSWEGEADKLYNIEYSDNLEDWRLVAMNKATIYGIGDWMDSFSSPSHGFYRVWEGSETTPSDPSGGDGISSSGATISVNTSGTYFTVVPNLQNGVEPSAVTLFVDGEAVGSMIELPNGTYVRGLARESYRGGGSVAYAEVDAFYDTTPENGEAPPLSIGVVRTQPIALPAANLDIHGFHVTETDIDDQDDDIPNETEIFATIEPGGVNYKLQISDEDGNVVWEFEEDLNPYGPTDVYMLWSGRGQNGQTLPFGPYFAELLVGGGGSEPSVGPILIRAGTPPNKALIVSESMNTEWMSTLGWTAAMRQTYRPPWAGQGIFSSGHFTDSQEAWGPWLTLNSVSAANPKFLDAFKIGNWRMKLWDSGNKYHKGPVDGVDFPEPFETGNPFNDYDLGILMGHGVASGGGTYTENGQQKTLPSQSYVPLIKNLDTGESIWLNMGELPQKFGEGGKLKWMFILSCNTFRVAAHNSSTSHNVFDTMKAAGTLPMSDSLHVLCGYTTKIRIEIGLGQTLAEGLLQKKAGVNSVFEAWQYAWQNTTNSTSGKNGRFMAWPECVNDTILGVPNEDVSNPAPGQPQTNIITKDTKFP